MLKLRDYQKDAVNACIADLKEAGNSICVLPTGCHEINYPIVMSDGSIKKVQDIQVNDFVMGFNSIPQKVTELHRGNEESFRITTSKGESFCVNGNHILHLRRTGNSPHKYKSYSKSLNISVFDYLNLAKSRKHLYKLIKRSYEPFASSDYFGEQGKIAYIIGIWLGGGTSACSQITNPDIEIIKYMKDFCAENGLIYTKLTAKYLHCISSGGRWSKTNNLFRDTLKEYDLYNNKHIPEIYFKSEKSIRLELLAGILDSDGHYDQHKNVYDLCLSNEKLFDDCIRLIRSLGFYCIKQKKTVKNGKDAFRTTISGEGQETIPCLVERKQARPRTQKKDVRSFGFTIEPIGKMDYYGFSITGRDKLYIDGQGFVQHNSGKSLVIAELANRVNKPVLIIQPSAEILEQNANKLRMYVNNHEIGIYSATFGKKQVRKYTFATIQSIYKKPHLFEGIGLVLIDECHSMNPKNQGSMFTSFLSAIGNPKTIGMTATPYRNMQLYHQDKKTKIMYSALTLKLLNRIKPDFWKRIIFNINNQELLKQGYLCQVKYFDKSMFDHKDIPMNKANTDFDTEKFSDELKKQNPTIIDLIIRAEKKMKSVLVFCSSVKQAQDLSQQVPFSASVDGKTPKSERDFIINGFRSGTIKTVFNVGVLTTGFDHPALDCIFMLRPTRSLSLWYQMIGRGVRIAEGKEFCVVVDFTGNTKSLGRIETINLCGEKRLLDKRYFWYLKTETDSDWNGKELYRRELK